ncbi:MULTISPECIES: gluconate 2-dehydrogenase subunit 3 family protein [unclassified Halomonas]|uniref:gluconate 2-dehydrogenase subunit 3 family protein n=1 Tax=unclassified Halomonas TaxID=2609666 RepID=UPI0007D9162C|nr:MULTISPECIES: gluconate 2-dehydrogenase subunit 3 family protein [unclassified Halomonas]MBT2785000.1 gluconate 2-dehydrogenase subunit 3 family protein [Halomonas sp. ISL-106]MBT2796694.1 gluconate 2-dehydrogenase subunit 3 family protein [Halomonas sp. ISL-104]OAL59925.1 Twin-arginine translocation pathway signal [Halomonas sp. ALS9]
MNRRELLKMIALTTGTAMIGGKSLFAFSDAGQSGHPFSSQDVERLDELAETILPKTDTPGAKDAGVGEFMAVFVSDCYTPSEREVFYFGLAQLEARSRAAYQRDFMALSNQQRLELVTELDREAMAHTEQQARKQPTPAEALTIETQTAQNQTAETLASQEHAESEEALPHYFTMMKQLTLFGFFTSEVGATEVLRYEAVPGSYDGCAPYNGEPAWAT